MKIMTFGALFAVALAASASIAQPVNNGSHGAAQPSPAASHGMTNHTTRHHAHHRRHNGWAAHVARCRHAHSKSYNARTNTYKIAGTIKRKCKA